MRPENFIWILIIITAVASRLLPHAWNFAPVTAIAIVSALYLPVFQSLILTFAIRFVSDLLIGFFSWPLMLAVYASHLFGIVMGRWVRKNKNAGRVVVAPCISAILFFLVTNFAFLYSSYPHNWQGIILAYTNGLPFFKGTMLGDFTYTVAMVGGFEAVKFFMLKAQSKKWKVEAGEI